MNEYIFFIHIFVVLIFILIALRFGKPYLITMVAIQAILANFFVIKQIDLFTKVVTATDVFIIGAIFSQNLLQEYFEKKQAIKAVGVSFYSMLFFLVMAKIHLLYVPSIFDTTHESFQIVFKSSFRIILASVFTFYVVQRVDILFFAFLKKAFKDKYLPLRMTLSSIIVQLIDTVMFSFLALYKNVHNIFDIIAFSFLIKSLVIFTASLFINFSKILIKKSYE